MSSESLTGDLQDGDLCDADIEVNVKRSEATVRFTIRNVSKKAEEDTAAYSPKFYVKNMPWRIRIRMKLGTRFEVCLCCRLPEDDESWSCKYGKEAFCRILPTSSDVICQDIFRPNYQTVLNTRVNSKTRDHSFSQNAIINNFVLDPKKCCIKDDAITLEMFICVTDPVNIPHTVSEEDDNCQEEVNDLIQAITLGDVEKCIALLQDSAYHSVEDNNGRTPLMWAAYKGNLKIVQLLVEANCKIDITDNFGYAPLMRAIEFGHMEVAKFLLEKGANINLATRDCLGCGTGHKFTALHFVEHNLISEHMVKFLINNGADLSSIARETAVNLVRNGARSQVDSSTVIWSIKLVNLGYHWAFELTKMLLQTEEHINDTDAEGCSPLMHAVHSRSPEIVQILLEKGANPTKRDKTGRYPFLESIYTRNGELVNCFLMYVPPFMINYAFSAAMSSRNIPIVRIFLENGARVNAIDEDGDTPLTKSIKWANYELTTLLTDYEADVNIKGKNGAIPICEAIKINNLQINEHLLRKGANINIFDVNGSTPLLQCIRNSDLNTLKLLVENHADVNLRDKNGTIPLMECLKREKPIFVKCLMDHGANLNFSNEEEEEIVSVAIKTDNLTSLMYLMDKGVDFSSCQHLLDKLKEENLFFAAYLNEVKSKKGPVTCKEGDQEEAASQN